jgi:hypothetical protein
MSLVKQYFNRLREVKERNRILAIERQQKIIEKELEIVEVVSKVRRMYIDDTLFNVIQDDDVEEIKWFILQLNDDETEYMLRKRHSYSANVQTAIREIFDPPEFIRCCAVKKYKELNEDEYYKLETQFYNDYDKLLESEWNEYKLKNGLSRPLLDLDTELTELNMTLEKHKNDVKNYPQKYVPRNVVRPVDPKLENLKALVQKVENEIKLKTDQIRELDKRWNEQQKRQYEFSRSMLVV